MPGPRSVEEYLAELPDDRRAGLEQLRETIRSVVPEATETISYRIPTFKHQGRPVVYYAAFKDHYSVFPASEAVVEGLGDEIEPYLAGKGTIRFDHNDSLPVDLVKRIVQIRLRENAALGSR
jgi:uncharacterized protein YdhG (YjbR/CyaY superfamily)